MQFLIHNITELMALIVAIIYYPHLKGSVMKWVLPFLMFVFFGELFAKYSHIILNRESVVTQYLIAIAECIFYGNIFYNLSGRKMLKQSVQYFVIVSVCTYVIGLSFYTRDYSFFLPSLIINGFFLALLSLIFIYTKFIDDDTAILTNEPGFWIAFGVSLFFAGSSIVFVLHNFIVENNLNLFGIKLHNIVPRIMCVVLYSSISIAIILCKKKTKFSSKPLS